MSKFMGKAGCLRGSRRGFIAAPLIGAIVFVTAIVFVVNINKAETNAVTQVAQEAYHNRINSIVELYRSDAGSLFREDMKAVIEQSLTSQCWNIFDISVENRPSFNRQQKQAAVKKARFLSCQRIKQTIQSVICSYNDNTNTECVNSCIASGARGTELSQCTQACGGGRQYGLQSWLSNLNQEFEFEGITLSPRNRNAFENFFNPKNERGNFDYIAYATNCQALVKELAIDCNAFAENKLQCCSRDTSPPGSEYPGEQCASSEVVPGCESGIFYVKIQPSDARVYANLPRIQAKDDAGNYLRGGALSDAREFYLPITFPLLRYLDRAYAAYTTLAYGENIGGRDAWEGILDGSCYAGTQCTDHSFPSSLGVEPGFTFSAHSISLNSPDAAEKAFGSGFYENVFIPAFENSLRGTQLDLKVLSGLTGRAECKWAGNVFTCDDASKRYLKETISSFASTVQSEDRSSYSPYVVDFDPRFKFIDQDPSFRVKKDIANEFCWRADLRYKR